MSIVTLLLTVVLCTVLGAVQTAWTAWVAGKLWEMFLLPVGPLPSFWVRAGAFLVIALFTRQYVDIPEEDRVKAVIIQGFIVPALFLGVGGFLKLFF